MPHENAPLQEPLKLKGAPGSPYTRKMLAYLRYRHIRYELLIDDHASLAGLPTPKVELLPTFYLPKASSANGELEAVVDSTPLIRRFEASFDGRATLPSDPVLNFLNYLIEDYGDEWLTKAMFHYRWYYAADIDLAGTILPHWRAIQAPKDELLKLKDIFATRQIDRLYVVGSNDTTAPVIEASYVRFLGIMDRLIERQKFVLGSRPAAADFGLYAQLTQLAKFDPTPASICLQKAPRVHAWVDLVEDLSGQSADESGWVSRDQARSALGDLLAEIGRTYVPALLANAKAIQAGDKQMSTTIDGQPWVQPAFPYQAKCLQWINAEYQALSATDQASVDDIFTGTGCEQLIF